MRKRIGIDSLCWKRTLVVSNVFLLFFGNDLAREAVLKYVVIYIL